jgi:hypothetical protein
LRTGFGAVALCPEFEVDAMIAVGAAWLVV